jgi:hypothetical protein
MLMLTGVGFLLIFVCRLPRASVKGKDLVHAFFVGESLRAISSS